ncbi:HTTM domain-containing protein [Adhaeribacter aquaticus]|uniref:HTTM domain-containing protein n=1 Tax=Adhaeribacter aquaticus TaxID=299567 RepID=UPI0004130FBF|nr:HTTM domain-containing protein [Adhaeribacter aquaticus]
MVFSPTADRYDKWLTWLQQPVDNSPLIIFRIFFGLLLFLETSGAIVTGWVKENLILPKILFPFIGFEWLKPLPGSGMYCYYDLMAVLGFFVLIGFWYRVSLGLFTLLWWATYLMQKTSYNNHYYLIILLCFLMLLVPANAYASWDARQHPQIRSLSCPRWCLVIFAAQLGIVYTFAAIAKIYPDWLAAKPISIWFASKAHYPVIGNLLQQKGIQQLIAFGGIAFDLTITPLLLWRRTRKAAFFLGLIFHLFNSVVFAVGVFPYMALAFSVFFFSPETSHKLFFRKKPPLTDLNINQKKNNKTPLIFYVLALYFVLQVWLPLRHWFIPGDVHWTEEGHRMAWQMMLRAKSGTLYYLVKDSSTGKTATVNPEEFLTPKQARILATRPDMIWQMAQYLKVHFQKQEYRHVQVYAYSMASLNGRPYQPLIDSTVNLAAVRWRPFHHAAWILPISE